MKRNLYIGVLLLLVVITFVIVARRNVTQKTRSDAFSPQTPTPTGYIPPTPIIPEDWNYDSVVDEQDEALETH